MSSSLHSNLLDFYKTFVGLDLTLLRNLFFLLLGSDTAEAPVIEPEAKVIIQEENVEPAKVIQEDQQEHVYHV